MEPKNASRGFRSERGERRHAVETAINLSKDFPLASWEQLAEEAAKRGVRPWPEARADALRFGGSAQ